MLLHKIIFAGRYKNNFPLRFNLFFMTINANYSISSFGVKTAILGLGFSLR